MHFLALAKVLSLVMYVGWIPHVCQSQDGPSIILCCILCVCNSSLEYFIPPSKKDRKNGPFGFLFPESALCVNGSQKMLTSELQVMCHRAVTRHTISLETKRLSISAGFPGPWVWSHCILNTGSYHTVPYIQT